MFTFVAQCGVDEAGLHSADMIPVSGATIDGSPVLLRDGGRWSFFRQNNHNTIDNKEFNSRPKRKAVGLLGGGRVVSGHATDGLSRLCAVAVFLFAGLLFAGPAATAEAAKIAPGTLPTLTTARHAHDLSSKEAARAYPVHLRAVVTYFDPEPGYKHAAMFVHDATGSIFVEVPHSLNLSVAPGALVDLRGVSDPGEFAPIVKKPEIEVIGYSGLPASKDRPSFSRMLSGAEDGQWVEVEGVVHSVLEDDRYINLQLTMEDGTITVNIVKQAGGLRPSLLDAKVIIRGNVHPVFDVSRRHMIGARLECPTPAAVKILESAPDDPFKLPVIPIDRLLGWDVAPLLAHRVHVQGRVTLLWPGSTVCLRDATQGICAQTDQGTRLAVGELIDLAGFARAEGNAPVLTNAVLRSLGGVSGALASAEPVTAEQVLLGTHESELIQIDGQLVSRDLATADTTLLLNGGKSIFTAILPQGLGGPGTNAWKNGSMLRITGICSVQIDTLRAGLGAGSAVPKTFRVLMRSPADVIVVRKASWWTPAHLVVLLALALIITLVALVWVAALRKRIRESEERFRHMALHDALTGLATRLLLEDRLNAAVEIANRHQTGLALLMVDLDRFKETNDTFGHQAGDEVLRVTADRLLEAVRKSDTVARIGGDEFVVLLADLRDPQIAERIAANIVETLAVPISFEGREMPVTVSVGVCAYEAGKLDADTMLKNVDVALYSAKKQGRNCFVVFTPELAGVRMEQAN